MRCSGTSRSVLREWYSTFDSMRTRIRISSSPTYARQQRYSLWRHASLSLTSLLGTMNLPAIAGVRTPARLNGDVCPNRMNVRQVRTAVKSLFCEPDKQVGYTSGMKLERILAFTRMQMEFQKVERVLRVPGMPDRWENDVEHSYNLAMLGWYIVTSEKLALDTDLVIKY
ncbi:MAG: metal dependent phosphohydrolase, putative hydrolase of superfamily, partial [Parcubacteria group bacterium]|nr:metal dependent phosphohydrolase, putative hydrolase of superfamily [Parcubacteria group bacterium]